jgi:transposase
MKIMDALSNGMSIRGVSKIFKIGRNTIHSWKNRLRASGSLQADKPSSGKKPIVEDLEKFTKFVSENPDRTQKEMAELWGGIAPRTISSTLKRAKITYKKKLWVQTKR